MIHINNNTNMYLVNACFAMSNVFYQSLVTEIQFGFLKNLNITSIIHQRPRTPQPSSQIMVEEEAERL